ncbi:MAG: YbaB/EbfC family nucleoid-associated protein [Sphingobacteriaceae bacterium]|nr:YbaB/EbfC family nucleoid-associated protein [Sphingobacteriaceae bacterium]
MRNLKERSYVRKIWRYDGQTSGDEEKADEAKEKLDATLLVVEGAGGDIKIEITGNRELKKLSIAPGLQHGGKEELEEQLRITLNKAIDQANTLNEAEMKKAASGLLPGLT